MWTTLFRALVLGAVARSARGMDVDLDDAASIRSVAATLTYDMMTYYHGNESGGIVGVLPGPPPPGPVQIPPAGYYWWESGAMWGAIIDYWHYTGDTSYNDVAAAGIQHQTGDHLDMMPSNWTQSMGNDDQAFWGMTAMTAAETNFQNPPPDQPGWLALAQAVYNTQAKRPDAECGGGLRWQVFPYLQGYDYKNSIANGCFFNIGARLARYTRNDTYAQEAEQIWDWITSVGLIDAEYHIYDGAHVQYNCTDINRAQFSYNMGVWVLGAATMYNYTNGSTIWKTRLDGLVASTLTTFFPSSIAWEKDCEPKLSACTVDMFSFKSYLTRWLAGTIKMAPYTYATIMPVLRASAKAAVAQCTGGPNGRSCGLSWSSGAFDGTYGVGQQMAAMSVVFVNLLPLEDVAPPLTNFTGGTSVGNPNAGSQSVDDPEALKPATQADRAGAGILTTLLLVSVTGMFGWMSS